MPVVTITVDQWRIKSNAETGANEPVVCVNQYAYAFEYTDYDYEKADFVHRRIWGPKIGETEHHYDFVLPEDAENVRTIYDPVYKTPCQASCWMQFVY